MAQRRLSGAEETQGQIWRRKFFPIKRRNAVIISLPLFFAIVCANPVVFQSNSYQEPEQYTWEYRSSITGQDVREVIDHTNDRAKVDISIEGNWYLTVLVQKQEICFYSVGKCECSHMKLFKRISAQFKQTVPFKTHLANEYALKDNSSFFVDAFTMLPVGLNSNGMDTELNNVKLEAADNEFNVPESVKRTRSMAAKADLFDQYRFGKLL